MKLSLTVEADAVNVQALNMGRIVVDIDGIELSELIAAVNQNGCTLRIADKPGSAIVESSLPPLRHYRGSAAVQPTSLRKTIRCCMPCRIRILILASRNGSTTQGPAT